MNIYIGEPIIVGDYTAMQGPAPDGFHVPLTTEWQGLKTIMDGLGLTTSDNWRINLHMPFAGLRNFSTTNLFKQGPNGYYWSSSPYGGTYSDYSRYLNMNPSYIRANDGSIRANGLSIRCFKDSYVTPTSSWTVIYGTLGSAGIFWNQTEGLITVTNGTTGYTMADKNLGATTVYSNGDTLIQANMGNLYQWGNNYGFPSTGTISSTSSTQVDASNYGPGNYYSSDTFITGSGDWSSIHNDNLRGGVTGVVQKTEYQEIKNIYIGEYGWKPGSNTLLYCPFNNDIIDYSGNSNTITATGTGFADIISGGNKCLKVTDTSGSITGPGTLMAGVGTGDFAVSLWLYPVSCTSAPILFDNRYEGGQFPGVQMFMAFRNNYFGVSNKLTFLVNATNNIGHGSSMSASSLVGSWHHMVFTRTSGVCHGYVDNVEAFTSWTDATSISSVNKLYILNRGNNSDQKWTSPGACISNLIVENKARTAQEISDYYNFTKSNYGL